MILISQSKENIVNWNNIIMIYIDGLSIQASPNCADDWIITLGVYETAEQCSQVFSDFTSAIVSEHTQGFNF